MENNLHLLKVDLKNQGLEVGRLEVIIASESEASGRSLDTNSKRINGQDRGCDREYENREDELLKDNGPLSRTENNPATVDYFA